MSATALGCSDLRLCKISHISPEKLVFLYRGGGDPVVAVCFLKSGLRLGFSIYKK